MTTVNLTRPIRTDSAAGRLFPWEAPYRTEEIATLTYNGANLFHITMGSGAATRLIGPALSSPGGATVDQLTPEKLVNRPATVVTCRPGEDGRITAALVADAFAEAGPAHGDAIVLATGWGDQPDRLDTDEYLLDGPHLDPEAATTLVELLAGNGSDLLLTDCGYLDRPGGEHARAEWTALQPWLRPTFPSDAARTYLEHYRPEKVRRDWAATIALTASIWTVVGLVGCAALDGRRIRLTLAPLPVQGVGEVPCTVVAQFVGDDGQPVTPVPLRGDPT
ncbi:cyclase family protein [Micromonospora sp. WMMD882]|uniref:cyclase family protein n=1 Tax=Micromonospora sp. WMMD882 TaxID=3015151 RepID=UPI00248BAA30|nr:cyclase family protein [Micromonospora sp. WMMD882]WBB81664.1 cyclase family protein [Micromonospora sp. WMMD882]